MKTIKIKKLKLFIGFAAIAFIVAFSSCKDTPPYGDNPGGGNNNGGKNSDSVWVGPYRDTTGG